MSYADAEALYALMGPVRDAKDSVNTAGRQVGNITRTVWKNLAVPLMSAMNSINKNRLEAAGE